MDIMNSTNYDYRDSTINQTQTSAESRISQTKPDHSVHGATPTSSPTATSAGPVTVPESVEAVSSTADQMILKALEASGLPASERNRNLVMELLKHQLPIDKQTLQMFAKLAATNRNASSLTLILLYKNQIPITPANIRQFDAYLNGGHQLLKDIQSLSKGIMELIKSLQKVQDQGPSAGAAEQNGAATFTETAGAPNHTGLSGSDGPVLTGNTASDTAATASGLTNSDSFAIASGLTNSDNSATASGLNGSNSTVMPGSLTGSDTLATTTGSINSDSSATASGLNDSNSTAMPESLTGSDTSATATGSTNSNNVATASSLNGSDITNTASGLNSSVITTTVPDNTNSPQPAIVPDQTQGFNPSDPQATVMLPSVDTHPNSQVDASNILKWLTDTLATSPYHKAALLPEGTLPELSQEFLSQLEQQLRQNWTLTPEQLAGKQSLRELYQKLEEDLQKLDELIRFQKETKEVLQTKEPVRNLQDNLQFMKDLSHLFSYIQLPIRFTDREVHGEFYVFNKKNALQGKKDILSVLLHLDMSELGAINIHMKLERNQIQATFAVEAPETVNLIQEHLPELIDSLTRKGYQLQARVEKQEHPQALMKEFLEQDPSGNAIKTFSFDIRA